MGVTGGVTVTGSVATGAYCVVFEAGVLTTAVLLVVVVKLAGAV